ncbi:MAG: hypothetical protein GY756_10605 [bacterium]|nr:hypothetical protein [bacterium]
MPKKKLKYSRPCLQTLDNKSSRGICSGGSGNTGTLDDSYQGVCTSGYSADIKGSTLCMPGGSNTSTSYRYWCVTGDGNGGGSCADGDVNYQWYIPPGEMCVAGDVNAPSACGFGAEK